MSKIALSEMIEELRNELQTAVDAGKGKPIRFELGEVTLEAQVEVKKQGGAKAGVKFWVAELGASGSAAAASTQKIVLKLAPRTERGDKVRLGREQAR